MEAQFNTFAWVGRASSCSLLSLQLLVKDSMAALTIYTILHTESFVAGISAAMFGTCSQLLHKPGKETDSLQNDVNPVVGFADVILGRSMHAIWAGAYAAEFRAFPFHPHANLIPHSHHLLSGPGIMLLKGSI
jgi:hypothetical protein